MLWHLYDKEGYSVIKFFSAMAADLIIYCTMGAIGAYHLSRANPSLGIVAAILIGGVIIVFIPLIYWEIYKQHFKMRKLQYVGLPNYSAMLLVEDTKFAAVLLERDIVAQGNTADEAIERLLVLIQAEYDYCKQSKKSFADIPRAPKFYWDMFAKGMPKYSVWLKDSRIEIRERLYQ